MSDKVEAYQSSLPVEPLDFRIYDTPMSIQFHNILDVLPGRLTRACLKQAVDVCTARRISGHGFKPLGPRAYSYSAGTSPESVHLVLVPQLRLTWVELYIY